MIFENKRSEIEIIGKILSTAKTKAKKTHMMYNTNLCYTHFIEYMDFLLEKNFIKSENGNPSGKIYSLTDKGEKFLDNINNVLDQAK